MTQLRDLPERLNAALNPTEPIGISFLDHDTIREAATAITALLDVADAAQAVLERIDKVYVQNLHREMLIEEQWPLLDNADALRTALAALKGEK